MDFSLARVAAVLPGRFIPLMRRSHHVVLIADAHLYPLALCYHQTFRDIAGVFRRDTPRARIIATLRHLGAGEKMAPPALPGEARISCREASVLEAMLRGVPARLLARHYRRDVKTLYGWRRNIARKLAVQQLNHLLMLPAVRPGDAADGGRRWDT